MSSIDDLLEGVGDHANFVEHAKDAPKGILFYKVDDESDKWAVSFHNIKLGDLGWCIAALQAEFSLLYHDDGEDE